MPLDNTVDDHKNKALAAALAQIEKLACVTTIGNAFRIHSAYSYQHDGECRFSLRQRRKVTLPGIASPRAALPD